MNNEPEFIRPQTLVDASEALRRYEDAVIVAGGTVIASLINQHLADPAALIDISMIEQLKGIKEASDASIEIGALVTHDEIHRSELIAFKQPLLREIAQEMSCLRLRTRGTLGGSVCTVGGQGDPATGLIALGGKLVLRRGEEERRVSIEDFYIDGFLTDLAQDEVLEKVIIPPSPRGLRTAFLKEGPRNAMDWTQLTVSASYFLEGGRIRNIRVGINGAAATPVRATHAEAALHGKVFDQLDWAEVKEAVDKDISPETDLVYSEGFKRHLVHVLLKRVLIKAAKES